MSSGDIVEYFLKIEDTTIKEAFKDINKEKFDYCQFMYVEARKLAIQKMAEETTKKYASKLSSGSTKFISCGGMVVSEAVGTIMDYVGEMKEYEQKINIINSHNMLGIKWRVERR